MTENISSNHQQSSDQSFQTHFNAAVAPALAELATVLRNGNDDRLLVALPKLLEATLKLEQATPIKGVSEIVTLIQVALLHHPEQLVQIAHLTLNHLQQIQPVDPQQDGLQSLPPTQSLLELAATPNELRELSEHLVALKAQGRLPLDLNAANRTQALPSYVTDSLVQELEAVLDNATESDTTTYLQPLPQPDDQPRETQSLPVTLGSNRGRRARDHFSEPSRSIKSRVTDYYLATTVRVDLKRLTQIQNLVGELVTQENLAKLHNHQYQAIVDFVGNRFQQFDLITQTLNDWLDRRQHLRVPLSTDQALPHQGKEPHQDKEPIWHAPEFPDRDHPLDAITRSLIDELAHLQEAFQDLQLLTNTTKYTQQQRQQTLKQVRDQLLQSRMLPVADVLQRFPRMVRDLSDQHAKNVNLTLSGTQTLLDKTTLEKLLDPLVHLVRNSFDHGIESEAVRVAQGKPPEGTIAIRAYAQGTQIYIEVEDDGRGIDCDAIIRKIVEQQILPLEAAVKQSPQQLYEYILMPGFSTTHQVTELSGRGVGMDAVQTRVRQLKGSITIESTTGQGTLFKLRFPQTLTTAALAIFQIQQQLFALPIDTLVAVATATTDQITVVHDQSVLLWQNKQIPLYPATALLGAYPLAKKVPTYDHCIQLSPSDKVPVLILADDTDMLAIPVDRLLQEEELVIKPFGTIATPPAYFYGCTILSDGSMIPVLDGPALITRAKTVSHDFNQLTGWKNQSIEPSPVDVAETVLVVDDSITARHFLAMILEKAGYQVIQVSDGREALDCLALNQNIKAVFCDVEMPRMSGFEFLAQSQKSHGSTIPPVIMLTSRSSNQHIQMAQTLGAQAYVTKPYLEQDVLQALAKCHCPSNAIVEISE